MVVWDYEEREMFGKIQLLILIGFSFVFGCKNIGVDYSALDDGAAKPTSAWALITLGIFAPSSEHGGEKGKLVLNLPEELRHESNFGGVITTFMASDSIVFAAPDAATNEVTPDSDTALINMVSLKLVDAKDKFLCPEGNGVVANLVRNTDESGREEIIFKATDLKCGGNKLVELTKLVGGVDELGFVPSHTWKSTDTARANGVLEDMEAFYAKENKEGGALQKTQHEETNEAIDIFLIRRKMLRGYVKMREEINSHANLEKMAGEVFNADKPDNKHVVIPAVLNGFLNPQVNRVDPEDNETADSSDFDTILMKEALLSTVLKFLQYQEMFQAEEFKSSEYAKKFMEVKSKFTGDLRTYIDEVEKKFNAGIAETEPTVYRSVSDIAVPLNLRVNNLNTFLNDEMNCTEYTCQKEGGDNCRKTTKSGVCEDITPRFYDELLAPSCKARGEEEEHNALYVLLMTQKIMGTTRINKPCEKYGEAAAIKNVEKSQDIIDGIVTLKKRTSENLETLAKIQQQGGGSNFRQKLFENHYYTLIPVVTKYPDKIAEVAADLKVAHDKVYEKRKTDERWQTVAKALMWTTGLFGGLAIVTAFIPPVGAAAATLAGITFTVAGTLGAASVVTGAFLLAVSTSDWRNERREFQELERAIYGGGQGNAAAQAAALREWHQARKESIIEGLSLAVAGRPAYSLIRRGPQAFRTDLLNFGKGTWSAVRHPIKTVKGLGGRTKDMFKDMFRGLSGQRLLGMRGGRATNLTDDVIKTGDPLTDSLRGAAKHAKDMETELVKYNQALQEKASMVKDLKKLRKSIGGVGRREVTDSGASTFMVKQDGLSKRKLKKIEKFFQKRATNSGGKMKFEKTNMPNGQLQFSLLHTDKKAAVEVIRRAQLMKLQEKLGKGIPRVKPDGSMHFMVERSGLAPLELKEINKFFKSQPQAGLDFKTHVHGNFRKYSLIPKPAP